MSFNHENYAAVRREFEQKRSIAQSRADERRAALYLQIDGLAEIDRSLEATAAKIMGAAFGGKAGLDERIAAVRAETEQLRKKREKLLAAAGYPADYTDPVYECKICRDSGFANGKMCACLRRALALRGYETSGIGRLIGVQTFENFSLARYAYDKTVQARMRENLQILRDYAQNFTTSSPSLLLIGGTGLGKTHLSSAIAKEVIDRGYDVLYDTAGHLFSAFEDEKFRGEKRGTDKYFSTEFLILDDLGTEMNSPFVTSCLYDLVNSRLLSGLPMLISTNLSPKDLAARYGERILSRLLSSSFRSLVFVGKDARLD